MIDLISKQLAPTGILRVGINMSNFLLVSGVNSSGLPKGVSPDLGEKIAKELNIPYKLIQYKRPGELADAVNKNQWDIGNIAFEPKRAETIDFSNSYVNIDANFLVRKIDNFKTNKDVSKAKVKIAVAERSAYDLWLSENFKDIELIRASSIQNSHILFNEGKANVLAGLKPKLIEELSKNDQLEIIEDPFTFIKQSVGIKKGNPNVIEFLNNFISKLINDGSIDQLLKKYKVDKKLSIPKL
ncbi:transporter substrate-binding domain-containing protein [Candidatus Pelagibacter sp.]|nr:transporter substrate-binding domain-containing protein [Candidatus Pelagibacter sp.]MDC1031801.1 transporter substrate-binding domain-containing protein [Candidatus Pelagibacter sp.]